MKAVFQVETPGAKEAAAACKVVGEETRRSKTGCRVINNSTAEVTVDADDFAALRAACTSGLRNLRVFFDSLEATREAGGKDKGGRRVVKNGD